jgi:hypothetical protein
VRSTLVTVLPKGIPSSSRHRCRRSLFRPEDLPPFDDALTERASCEPRAAGTGGGTLVSNSDDVSLRRGVLPGGTAFSSCYSLRGGSFKRMGQRTAAARTRRGGAWAPRVPGKVEWVFDEMPDLTSPMALSEICFRCVNEFLRCLMGVESYFENEMYRR